MKPLAILSALIPVFGSASMECHRFDRDNYARDGNPVVLVSPITGTSLTIKTDRSRLGRIDRGEDFDPGDFRRGGYATFVWSVPDPETRTKKRVATASVRPLPEDDGTYADSNGRTYRRGPLVMDIYGCGEGEGRIARVHIDVRHYEPAGMAIDYRIETDGGLPVVDGRTHLYGMGSFFFLPGMGLLAYGEPIAPAMATIEVDINMFKIPIPVVGPFFPEETLTLEIEEGYDLDWKVLTMVGAASLSLLE